MDEGAYPFESKVQVTCCHPLWWTDSRSLFTRNW